MQSQGMYAAPVVDPTGSAYSDDYNPVDPVQLLTHAPQPPLRQQTTAVHWVSHTHTLVWHAASKLLLAITF